MKHTTIYWYLLPPFMGIIAIVFHQKFAIFLQKDVFHLSCPLYTLTGYYCPFCGCTRSTIDFLQGNFGESLRKNPLIISVCVILILSYLQFLTKKKLLPKNHNSG